MLVRVDRAEVEDDFYDYIGKVLTVYPQIANDSQLSHQLTPGNWITIPRANCTVLNDESDETGCKYDDGKIKAGCLRDFALALKEVAKVATHGCEKYKRSDWLKVDNAIERYTDAQDRHALELWAGNEIDESGCLHEAQVIWNALAVLEIKLREKL